MGAGRLQASQAGVHNALEMGEQPPKKAGRPPEAERRLRVTETILDRVAAGEALSEVCSDLGWPTPVQFRTWMRAADPLLKKRWKEARVDHAHALFDELVRLSHVLAHGKWDKDANAQVTAIRVAIDGLKHATARLLPSDYGEQKAGAQAMSVTIVTSLPMGPGSVPEAAVDTAFKVVGTVPQVEDRREDG